MEGLFALNEEGAVKLSAKEVHEFAQVIYRLTHARHCDALTTIAVRKAVREPSERAQRAGFRFTMWNSVLPRRHGGHGEEKVSLSPRDPFLLRVCLRGAIPISALRGREEKPVGRRNGRRFVRDNSG